MKLKPTQGDDSTHLRTTNLTRLRIWLLFEEELTFFIRKNYSANTSPTVSYKRVKQYWEEKSSHTQDINKKDEQEFKKKKEKQIGKNTKRN